MSELLFEIGVEDLPASYVESGRAFLQQGVSQALDTLRLPHGAVQAFGTPRRLTVLVRDMAQAQQDWQEELLGPRVEIAWIPAGVHSRAGKSPSTTKENHLSRAGQGFLRSTGMQEHDLFTKQTPKGEVVAVRKTHKGKPARELLPEALHDLINRVPFAKTMRWDDSGARFARPVRWLLFLLDGRVLPMTFGHVQSGDTTRGHRFLAPQPVRVTGIDHYEQVLQQHSVMLDGDARRQVIVSELQQLAQEVGGRVLPDDELLDLVVNIVERPWPIRGAFDKSFLKIPRDILLCEMRTHQKCFAVVDEQGDLLPFFIAVCGTSTKPQSDNTAAAGNRRVLTARFEDGAFYFTQDCRQSLQEHAQALTGMAFAKGLGSMADKAARMQQLADFLAQTLGLPQASRESVHRAARLCKADLATGVVGEFPQLQGIMGGIYAQREGQPQEVAQGIAQHYQPRFAADALPTSESGAVVGLADRLDTLAGVLAVDKPPAGNRDPFALRRAAVAVCRLIVHHGYRLSLCTVLPQAVRLYGEQIDDAPEHVAAKVLQFLRGRLAAAFATSEDPFTCALSPASTTTPQREQEHAILPSALVEAVAAAGCDDLLDVWARVHVINRWRGQDSAGFGTVTAAFKRVANLLDKVSPTCRPEHPPRHPDKRNNSSVIPAKAGIHNPPKHGEILSRCARQDDKKKAQDDGMEPTPDPAKHLTHASEQNLLTDVEQLHAWLQQQDAAKLPKKQLLQHYEQLLRHVVAVKPKLDALFDAVMVMDSDPTLRQARLWLLGRLQQCLAGVADFKRLAGCVD